MPGKCGVSTTPFCPHLASFGSSVLSLACCIVLFLVAQHIGLKTASAQNATATLSGVVKDQNGDVISGARVEVLNPSNAVRRQTTTNDEGFFTVSVLNPGSYTVKVEAPSFALFETSNVTLNVNDQVRIPIELKTGQITQNVEVKEISTISESAAVGVAVNRRMVENMPLNGRSFQSLLSLIPGYVLAPAFPTEPGQFSFNGQRTNTNNFMVDGVSANVSIASSLIAGQTADGSLPGLTAFGGTNNLVAVEALEEFKVQTSTYSAEFGRIPGGQISIVTRSGTNEFHGNLFEYFRNEVLDANDWFFNSSDRAKAPLRHNQFGGVIGGPVTLPRFGEGGPRIGYNGKNRTFFFFSYEGLRLRQPLFLITDVPSLTARASGTPAVRELLNAFPRPNGPENPATKLAQFSAAFSTPTTLNATSIRLDHYVGQKFTLFGRYNDAPSETIQRTGGTGSINTLNSVKNRTRTLTVGSIQIAPAVNNELRVNYSLVTGSSTITLDSFGGAVVPSDSLLFPSFTSREEAFFSLVLLQGRFSTLLSGSIAENTQHQFNVVDNLSVSKRKHNLKFGIDYRRLLPTIGPRMYSQGLIGTVDQTLNGTLGGSINAENAKRDITFNNLSLYGQDLWHVNSRLTLTYGLRWEFNLAPSERNGNEARTVTGIDNAATIALAPAGTPLFEATYNNFAPRFGFSYQLRQRPGRETIVRGGLGIFYDLGTGPAANAYSTGAFPFSSFKPVVNGVFPLSLAAATPAPVGAIPSLLPAFVAAFEPNYKLPYTIQFNGAVEQSLGAGQNVTITYVGARGRRLLRKEQVIALPFVVEVTRNNATSDYDGLQLQFQRRLTRGLQVLSFYSFSKSLDNTSKDSFAFASIFRIDPRTDRGPSDFDVRHLLSASISYDVPAPPARQFGNALLRNWSMDSIIRVQTALPVNVLAGRLIFGISGIARPDLVEGVPLYLDDPTVAGGRKINRAAFLPVPLAPGTTTPIRQGSLGRNALRGFPLFQIDFSVRRQFNFTERVSVQFKTDFFNILNHPNFGSVCANLTTCGPGFGQSLTMFGRGLGTGGINGGFNPIFQIGGPRSIQLSLKLQY